MKIVGGVSKVLFPNGTSGQGFREKNSSHEIREPIESRIDIQTIAENTLVKYVILSIIMIAILI
ncbi:hypothetical protein [Histophilus somni]|uniref:hypothetical protein n=1 Tax=Histophilus somni TaxID=731 RepID=UPI00201F85D1|nr:hypothetical protein [Histophilus somni]